MDGWHSSTLRCLCHDLDVCPQFEDEYSKQQSDEWWNSLTEEEKASMRLSICTQCYHAFENNADKDLCRDCDNWLTDYDEYGINF